MVTAGRPTYDVGMRASLRPELIVADPAAPDPTRTGVVRRRLPRPVVWLLWLLGALLGSVVLGFLAGLARPREPDPWSYGAYQPPADPPTDPSLAAPSEPVPPRAEDD